MSRDPPTEKKTQKPRNSRTGTERYFLFVCYVHSTQYTVHNNELTVNSVRFTVHSTQYTEHRTQNTVHSTQYTVHSTQYTYLLCTPIQVAYPAVKFSIDEQWPQTNNKLDKYCNCISLSNTRTKKIFNSRIMILFSFRIHRFKRV